MATSSQVAESEVRAHVVAVLGPNPASLTELLWALVRVRGMQVASVRIVVESARTLVYVERELLGGVGAYEDLRSCLADRLPPAPRLVAPDQLPAHETSDEVVQVMPEVFWTAATEALAEAGPEECVVFGLTGGRRRASHAAVTSVFQFLARPQDLLFDVRVSRRQAEGGSGFFFPEQRRQQLVGELRGERVPFQAKDVAVRLDQVEVPRLRAFLTVTPPPTFAEALETCRAEVARVAAPEVVLDLQDGKLFVDGVAVRLSPGNLALLALALSHAGSPHGVPSMCFDELAAFLAGMPWRFRFKSGSLYEALVEGDASGRTASAANNLRAHWSSLKRALVRGGCPDTALPFLLPRAHRVVEAGGGRRSFRRVQLPRARLLVLQPATEPNTTL